MQSSTFLGRKSVDETTFTELETKATEFGKITQNNGHYGVQGHSRSPILVPIESPYPINDY